MTEERDRPTPADNVALAVRQWGVERVVRVSAETIGIDPGTVATGEPLVLIVMIGSGQVPDQPAASAMSAWLAGGKPPGHRYWARVWACRALLYVWSDHAGPAVVAALSDEHWRVREMAGKVIAKREVPDGADALATLAVGDPVPRVRAAACRALAVVGEGEHLPVLARAIDDTESLVASAAERALDRIEVRLDRHVR